MIFGSGAVGRLVCEIAEDMNSHAKTWNVIGFLDENVQRHGTEVNGVPVLGDVRWLTNHPESSVVIAVGEPSVRRRIALAIGALGHTSFPVLIHPRAWIARRVEIGVGVVIYPGVLVDPDVRIGNHVILNKNCTIGHDTIIGDYVTVAPGVNIGGVVLIGEGCDLGINSATVHGISIGQWSILGAGAVVVKDLPPNVTAVGTPAEPIKKRPDEWHKNSEGCSTSTMTVR